MLVIGTAGHIDHGKSSIVKRLTNTDPDRLPEEKKRGMTIDLGFAFYKTEQADTIAFVDVPGHERFVKNMVSGVGGIDVVMLVIAADDGWMPQTEEHFRIVKLLKVPRGIVVINKIDLADDEILELLEMEIAEKTAGSFLEEAPIVKISAQTGDGFIELKSLLEKLPSEMKSQRDIGKPRLYIDRSFVRPGIGGVVTGTLRGGELSVGETVTIFPSLTNAKIKSLHSNNKNVETAVPGQRTAISFTGIDKELLHRGGVIFTGQKEFKQNHQQVLALQMEIVPNAPIAVEDGRRILFILGTTEVEGEVRIYNRKQLNPQDKDIIFFKPDEQVLTHIGDHWIGRLPTPMITIGGGTVLDILEHFPRKKEIEEFEYLKERIDANLEQLIKSELLKEIIKSKENFFPHLNYSDKAIAHQIEQLITNKVIEQFEGYIYLDETFSAYRKKFTDKIKEFLHDKPHLNGILYEQTIDIFPVNEEKIRIIINYMLANGILLKTGDKYNLSGVDIKLKGAVKQAHEKLLAILSEEKFTPPAISKLVSEVKQSKEAIRFMIDTKQVYKCGSEFLFLTEYWNEIVQFIKNSLTVKNEFTVADLKDKFDLSRKYTIPILEETDRIGLTKRNGDIRVKGDKFEN